jgi:hypothetical protein
MNVNKESEVQSSYLVKEKRKAQSYLQFVFSGL